MIHATAQRSLHLLDEEEFTSMVALTSTVTVHNGFGHWLTITNIGAKNDAEVMVYDSLYPSDTYIQKQIATLLRNTEKEVKVNIMDMQMQSGTCDCGLFAIATATSLLNGTYPGGIT